MSTYPKAVDPARVGTYLPLAPGGDGFVFDEVLEYRVWYRADGKRIRRLWYWADDGQSVLGEDDVRMYSGGETAYRAFATCEEAAEFSKQRDGAEEPMALVLQREHVRSVQQARSLVCRRRVAEWPVKMLDDAHRRTPENLRRLLGDSYPSRATG